ncbi:MAG: hypothetical protein JSV78_12245 [Phycisphaerales bacterium]|nr:MAG: hypothetical protein JSV78_12245 [Phycisphaerales bacterium]
MLLRLAVFLRAVLDALIALPGLCKARDPRLLSIVLAAFGGLIVLGLMLRALADTDELPSGSHLRNPAVTAACRGTDVDVAGLAVSASSYKQAGTTYAGASAHVLQQAYRECGYRPGREIDLNLVLCAAVRYHVAAVVLEAVYGGESERDSFTSPIATVGGGAAIDDQEVSSVFRQLREEGAFQEEYRFRALVLAGECCGYDPEKGAGLEMARCVARQYHAIQTIADAVLAEDERKE